MNYEKLGDFEIRQFVRILSENYFNIKYSFNLLEHGINTLKLEDKRVLKRYRCFKNFLEKELKTIYKISGKETLQEFIGFFPKIQRRRRPKNIKIRITKRNKNI